MKTATAPLPPLRSVKVLDQLRERIRYLHYSLRTEQAYVNWVRAFIRFHGVRHPATLGSSEVEAFLSWLANERKVSVSTHRQALAALLFFYGKVLCTDLPWLQEIGRPRPSRRLPVVLTPDEVVRILGFLEGEHRLFAQLLYGTGMRISEGLQLRVKDLDFDHGTIIVREGKGSKDRALMLPESLAPSLREQLSRARAWWLKDQAEGRSGVALPDALERKYPRAGHSWPWFWVFAQHTHSTDPRSGVVRRHHMYDQTFQRAFKRAKRGVRNFRFVSLQRLTIRKTHRASNETAIYSYQDYQYHIFEKAVSVMKEKTHRGSSIGWQDPGIGLRFRLVQHQYNLLISPRQK